MKKSALMLLAGTTMALASAAQAQVFSQSPALVLPDDPTVSTAIVVAGGPLSISDLNVVFQLEHTWDSDVDAILEGPNGHICLTSDNGGAGENYSTTRFDDAAAASVVGAVAPFADNFRPEGTVNGWFGTPATFLGTNYASLSGFNGSNANGTWTLYLDDGVGGDTGVLHYWSLEFNGSVDPNGPLPITAPTNPAGVGLANPAFSLPGGATLLTVSVTPGSNPTSSGISVVANLTAIGGGAAQAFLDNGLNGDVTAGDGVYSFNATVGNVPTGAFSLPVTITDAQARSGSANIAFSVIGEPSTYIDLGNINCANLARVDNLGAGEVKWYKMTLPAIADAVDNFADMWCNSTGTIVDSEMGLFDAAGQVVAIDDDSANNLNAMLTFGDTVNLRPDVDNFNFVPDGFNGTLDGGVYWLAVGGFNATFADGWSVTTTSVATGTIDLRMNIRTPNCSIPPSGAGNSGVVNECGGNVVATVLVTPGSNPASTGITVSLNAAAVGGGTVAMLDNGTGGDATANDSIYSATVAVAGGADQVFALPFTVTDAQARSSGGSISISRSGSEVGDLPASAKTYYGAAGATITGNIGGGSDVDMFAICVSDTANFEAGVNNGGAAFDTQLFLFNADGTGAAMNDDEPDVAQTLQSHLMLNNSLQVTPDPVVLPSGGLYYLALSPYNRDPITSAAVTDTIWANTGGAADSFDETWTPNGVTPSAPVVGWTNVGNVGGDFTITMVGATTVCPADLSGGTAGVPDCAVDINDLLYFLTAFEAGNADVDNGSNNGVRDCATDINDLLFFLIRFEAGC